MLKRSVFACAIALGIPLLAVPNTTTASKVEKDAHAEAILWEVWVSDEASHTVMKHHLRVIVFDECLGPNDEEERRSRGSEEGRDLRAGHCQGWGLKIKTTSFALPGLELGAIVEYGWVERHPGLANYVRLPLQREYPVQTVSYHIKPLSSFYLPFSMRAKAFNAGQPAFEKESDGSFRMTFTNLPALREEPDMPPENEVSSWILIYYAPKRNVTPDEYWRDQGKDVFEFFRPRMKVSGNVRQKANELIQGATTVEDRLRRLFLFCRSSIKNVSDPGADLTPEQRTEFKENKTPADTLKRGLGTGIDIDLLFAALANAAGFEARYARMADRSEYFFHKDYANDYFMRAFQIALRVKGKWMFFDPASTYVPFGMLRWQEEGNYTLITDNKDPEMTQTEISGPDKSVRRHSGRFALSGDGTLEGDVRITHSGHRVVERRREFSAMKREERLESLKKDATDQFPGAEVSNLDLQNLSEPELPLSWTTTSRFRAMRNALESGCFCSPRSSNAAGRPGSQRRRALSPCTFTIRGWMWTT